MIRVSSLLKSSLIAMSVLLCADRAATVRASANSWTGDGREGGTVNLPATDPFGPAGVSTGTAERIPAIFQAEPPGSFGKIAPTDESYVTVNPTLSWEASSGAETYKYCIDVFDNDTCNTSWISTGASTSVDLSGLGWNNVYFWQVRASNAEGTVEADGGAWLTFTALGQFFVDIPPTHWAWMYIERMYHATVTGACGTSPLRYCPNNPVTRAQMSIFLVRTIHGLDFPVPVATGTVFADVPIDYWSANWIEQLYADGITGGCGGGNFCPDQTVTRAQMAIFLLRGKHGAAYTPPPAAGVFPDVPTSYWAAAWIEQLYAEGITSGCGGGNFCPGQNVTRAQMAVFMVKTFNLK